jgi:hypothetical protein
MFFSASQPGMRVAAFALIFASGATAQVPAPAKGSSQPRSDRGQPQSEERAEILPVFEFHSGFWVNLHHFLYQQARIREKLPVARGEVAAASRTTRAAQGASTPTEMSQPAALTPDEPAPSTALPSASLGASRAGEARAWSASLDYYAATLAGRDLLVDSELVDINNVLAQLESSPQLIGGKLGLETPGLPPKMVAALEQAAPVYRAHWWKEHDRANRSWIAAVAPRVRQLGGNLAEQLAAIYHAEWPAGSIRVDVTIYAGRMGGYTSLDPLHVTISSSDTRNQGAAALEVLFHEASHALAGAVREGIARECRARNKPIPRDLWHALVFYTTGEIVRRALSVPEVAAGGAASQNRVGGNYTPYAYRYGLYARGWQNYERLLERYWQPYLDGREEFDRALAHLVAAL